MGLTKVIDKYRIIISGAPGTGKTSLIQALESSGYKTFSDVSRELIEEGLIPPVWDKNNHDQDFGRRVLEARIEQYKLAKDNSTAFFDRGIPDALIFSRFLNKTFTHESLSAVKKYRYYKDVFILSPWIDIFKQDDIRKESFEEIQQIHRYTIEQYEAVGYNCIMVPETSVEERLHFVLSFLKLY